MEGITSEDVGRALLGLAWLGITTASAILIAAKVYKARDSDGMIRVRLRIWKPTFYAVLVGLGLVLVLLLGQ